MDAIKILRNMREAVPGMKCQISTGFDGREDGVLLEWTDMSRRYYRFIPISSIESSAIDLIAYNIDIIKRHHFDVADEAR